MYLLPVAIRPRLGDVGQAGRLAALGENLGRLVEDHQLCAIAARHDATPAAIALAWTIAAGPVVVIPGASSIGQLEANVAAADIVLRGDEQQSLAAAASEVREGSVGVIN